MPADMDLKPGPGERATEARRRRLYWIVGPLALTGGVVGFLSAQFEAEGGNFLDGIPAVWAIIASIMIFVAIAVGTVLMHRATDEMERRTNLFAAAWALNVYLVGYPIWYLWWKGGLVAEPSHEALFVVTFLTMAIAYFWQKLRS